MIQWLSINLVAMTAVAVAVAWLVRRAIAARRRDAEELRRMDNGLCPGCGQDLAGLIGRCTACGRKFKPHEAVKVRPGLCPACGYDLTGNVSGTCPECGVPAAAKPAAAPDHDTRAGDAGELVVEGAAAHVRDHGPPEGHDRQPG